jgi:hypothetical protein
LLRGWNKAGRVHHRPGMGPGGRRFPTRG